MPFRELLIRRSSLKAMAQHINNLFYYPWTWTVKLNCCMSNNENMLGKVLK
jgi:hypothetical protein